MNLRGYANGERNPLHDFHQMKWMRWAITSMWTTLYALNSTLNLDSRSSSMFTVEFWFRLRTALVCSQLHISFGKSIFDAANVFEQAKNGTNRFVNKSMAQATVYSVELYTVEKFPTVVLAFLTLHAHEIYISTIHMHPDLFNISKKAYEVSCLEKNFIAKVY